MRLLVLALLVGACGAAPSSSQPVTSFAPEATGPGALGLPSATPIATPSPAQRAPSGVATEATVRGTIYLGFESCVGLAPDAASGYRPPVGDEFVLFFPNGWKVVPEHPRSPRFGDHFEVHDPTGRVVARDGDTLEVTGQIRAIAATFCGFGWPINVREAHRVGT